MATAEFARTSVGIHNVLVATDFSHHSDSALKFGLDFAHLYGAQAEIVYVLPTEDYVIAAPDGMLAARESARRDLLALKNNLRQSRASNEDDDPRLTMLEGPVAESLLEWAHDKKIDLIVVGTHGRGELGKIILGSVAEKIFRQSPVPVLTIGPNMQRPHRLTRVRQILAPCDLTSKSHPAIRYACTLAEAHDSKLVVLHVIEGKDEGTKFDPERAKMGIRDNLAEIVGKQADGLDVHYRVEFGTVASTILDVASDCDTDLVVLGVRPSSGLLDRFMWPIAYALVREATYPVLTIRGRGPIH